MHNAYFSSTLVTLRSKGSPSFSLNDYSNFLNERFDRTPLSCCSCCCSCCSSCEVTASHSNRTHINTSYLYGLRQSTLIQCPPYKKLTFGARDRIFSRLPASDLDRDSYKVSCSIRRSGDEVLGWRRKGRFRCMVSEEKSERSWLGGVDDAEAVISLLTEEVGEEYLGGTERNVMLCKTVVVKNEDHGAELYRGRKKKVEVEKRGNYGGERSTRRKKNIGSNLLESDMKCEFESSMIESREEGYRRNEGRAAIARGDKHRERTKSSSCSSYYSLPSTGEYGSDEEGLDEEEQIVEESVGGFRKDSSQSEEDSYKTQAAEEFNVVDRHEAAVQRPSSAGSRVEWDCRKKSEKKLTEVVAEDTKSRKQSSQIHWRRDGTSITDYGKASTSHKQFDDVEEESALAMNLDKGTRKTYGEINIQDTKQSRSRWQEISKMEEIHGSNIETTSESQKQFSGREENLSKGEHCQTIGLIPGNNNLKSDSQQLNKTSEILNVRSEKVSDLQRHSQSRRKVQQNDKPLVPGSVQQREEKQQQRSDRISGKIDLRRETEYLSELSEAHGTNLRKSSTVQSETRTKNQEANSGLRHSQKDREHHQRIHSWRESQDVTRVSAIQASDTERHTKSQRSSERRADQESALVSVMETMGETNDGYSQPDKKVMQTEFGKEAKKPTRVSSSDGVPSEESCRIQASLNLVSQARMQQVNVEEDEEEERISETILMAPPPQLLGRSSQHAGSTSGFAVQEVSSESGSSALCTQSGTGTPYLRGDSYVRGGQDETSDEPLNLFTHEDALGSARRLGESSTQFVGEFVEKARHEVSTSDTQKETKTEWVSSEGEKQFKENSGQYVSEDLQLKQREPRRSSDGSGAKGPSDEMWDVTDSIVQPQSAAVTVNQAADNAIVKRRGRSLWNIMADVVRLRWGSHAETPSSAAQSDAKSPSNNSVSSETWFSGRESDKNADDNMKREGSGMSQDATPFHQLQQGSTSTHSQGETYDKMTSKSKEQKLGADMPSSSNIIEGGSTSKRILRISSNPEEKIPGQKSDGISSQSTSSGQVALPPSSRLPAESSRKPPSVEAIPETGKTHASESGFQVSQPFNSTLIEVSGSSRKDGELKQRKLNRNKQVLKDKFDEWEGAIPETDKTHASESGFQLAQPLNSTLIEVSGPSRKDGELKQRKLNHNKQVLKDKFDEWEEAYKLESEQRKVDEIFMREALLEAKKAADTWEVPVGAVLVQHGKIIARGCNLVEELRDSTAHAEMICIREASNVLQTWRLADTTLYVTLEPCPMCAGAILQARVNTLVWGAPNKLLGADGSWIRLFPDGGEKRDGSEPSEKPAAPVHPFHPNMTIRRGVLATECADVMQQFFQLRRKEKKKADPPPPPPSCLPITNQQSKIVTKMQQMFHLLFCL